MQTFEWIDATSVDHAIQLLSAADAPGPVIAKAGGMDILDLMKEGIVRPARVVNLKSIEGLNRIRFSEDEGLEIGSLVTLARIASAPEVRSRYRALADAALHASTPQVRNVATIGGNLLQRPRCWYFRNGLLHSSHDVETLVRAGEHQYHAIFDNSRTAMVHASTPATALVAYDAQVELHGPNGARRTVPLRQFFRPPAVDRDTDTVIEGSEVLTRIVVPTPHPGSRAAYHKQTERDSYDWPICDAAVLLDMDGATVRSASIVAGWVAPTPYSPVESERLLAGRTIDEDLAAEAAEAALAAATPLSKNAYKVPVLKAVIRRTILAAAASPSRP